MLTKKKIAATVMAIGLVGTMAACEGDKSSTEEAQESRSKGVDKIRANQKVSTMEYSSTLNTIDRWTNTWGKKGKVSYVYMQRADGTFAGYYVLDGLPVSYCTAGAPEYEIEGNSSGGYVVVPGPSSDGAYYGGCDENRYYGFDAVTGQYIEYTDGLVLTAVLSDQPLKMDNQPQPFGSTIEDVEKKGK